MTYPVAQLLTASTFHPIKNELAENSIRNALEKFTLTQDDAARIREFISELRSCKNISVGRANKLTFTLVAWRRFIGPFSGNTIGDLYAAIPELRNAKSYRERPFKQNTTADIVAILKQFYHWMIENKYSDINENKIHKLRRCNHGPKSMPADPRLPITTTVQMNMLITSFFWVPMLQ
ncbi:hypothetical protein [uncultured Methanoregula sp.]|uniref:hypothetical protein n=1 Tax=uncultured Methanoregula sp. TaxID=1005933 RepID=UPI002AAB9898|nr:hypothetical protein [uncultured Methanoregula sp.]